MVKHRWDLFVDDDSTRIIDEVIDRIDVQQFLSGFWHGSIIPEYRTAEVEQSTEDIVKILNIFKKDIERCQNEANAKIKEEQQYNRIDEENQFPCESHVVINHEGNQQY